MFVRNEDGTESLLNFSMDEGDVVIHRVAARFILRRGQLTGCVVNKGTPEVVSDCSLEPWHRVCSETAGSPPNEQARTALRETHAQRETRVAGRLGCRRGERKTQVAGERGDSRP